MKPSIRGADRKQSLIVGVAGVVFDLIASAICRRAIAKRKPNGRSFRHLLQLGGAVLMFQDTRRR
jgi:hypothetical protein